MTESSKACENDRESLLKSYREMSADPGREHEAREWCESLISDVLVDVEPDDPQAL
jgi:hypothetical protein